MPSVFELLFDTYGDHLMQEQAPYDEAEIQAALDRMSMPQDMQIQVCDLLSSCYLRWGTAAFAIGLRLGLSLMQDCSGRRPRICRTPLCGAAVHVSGDKPSGAAGISCRPAPLPPAPRPVYGQTSTGVLVTGQPGASRSSFTVQVRTGNSYPRPRPSTQKNRTSSWSPAAQDTVPVPPQVPDSWPEAAGMVSSN